jgi:hypothetical protein
MITTIAYVLAVNHFNVFDFLRPSDFMTACAKCDARVIALYFYHPEVNFAQNDPARRNPKSITDALATIITRDDPSLLSECLGLIPELALSEPKRTRPLKYILKGGFPHL